MALAGSKVQETGRDSGVDNTYGGLALVRGAETLHLGHLLIGRLIRHAGLLRAVATLWVSSDGVLGVVVSAVVVVEMKSGVRGAGLGCEGGRRRLLLR
jgi:hypothetical protein